MTFRPFRALRNLKSSLLVIPPNNKKYTLKLNNLLQLVLIFVSLNIYKEREELRAGKSPSPVSRKPTPGHSPVSRTSMSTLTMVATSPICSRTRLAASTGPMSVNRSMSEVWKYCISVWMWICHVKHFGSSYNGNAWLALR